MNPTRADIASIRRSYERAELNEDASHADPLQQFGQWFDEALKAEVLEPNAMTVCTVGSDLRSSALLATSTKATQALFTAKAASALKTLPKHWRKKALTPCPTTRGLILPRAPRTKTAFCAKKAW